MRGCFACLILLLPGPAFAGPPHPETLSKASDLTAAVRERIDRLALASPPQKTAEMSLDLGGDVAAWLLKHVALSDEEEQELAAPVHERILAEHQGRIRPTPAALSKALDRLLAGLPAHRRPALFRYSLTV